MERFSEEDILHIADVLNQRPRRVLGYHTPAELFDAFFDEVYAIDNVSRLGVFKFNLQFTIKKLL